METKRTYVRSVEYEGRAHDALAAARSASPESMAYYVAEAQVYATLAHMAAIREAE